MKGKGGKMLVHTSMRNLLIERNLNTLTGASTNPKKFDLNKNLNLFEIGYGNWNLKLKVENTNSKLKLKIEIEIWNLKFKI